MSQGVVRSVKALLGRHRARTEEADRLAAVLDGVPDYAIIGGRPEEITFWSAGAEQMLGYRADEVVGRPATLFTHATEVAVRARVAGVEPPGEVFVAAARRGETETREWTFVHKDGSHVPVSLTITALRGDDGELVEFLGVARDITRERRNQRYRATREQLVHVLTSAPDLEASLRLALQTIERGMDWNAGMLWLEEEGELRCAEVHSGDRDVSALRDRLQALRVTPSDGLAARAWASGESIWVEDFQGYGGLSPGGEAIRTRFGADLRAAVCLPLRPAPDAPSLGVIQFFSARPGPRDAELLALMETMAATVARHVERERSAAALSAALSDAEAANRAMSEFVSRVSHELRTPLNAILGFAQLLERDAEDPHARERAAQISVAGTHLVALIDDLLDLGQLERGALRVSLEPVSATEVVRMTLELARPLIDERGLELELDLHDGLYAYVSADFRRLRQVLLNLVANAVKYNRERGKIAVRFARTDSERLRFVVADTGPGVPEDVLPRLFAPFDRLGAERGSEPGTGLGLAVSKALIEAMDGTIGVENGDGEGASFWVELGLVAPPEDEAEPGPAVRAARAEGATPPAGTVLYVEDNPANVRLMEEIFEGLPGVRLLTALEGGTGIELAAAERPDLVLLDAQLPDLPGEEVLDRLRADAATAGVPVLVLSADATDRHRRAFLARGAAGYLTKPLDVPAFVDELGRLLDGAG